MIQKECSISCADGVRLRGTLYRPEQEPKAAIMIGPATGIKRQFYRHFASYLAEHGFGVLSFDNRGIGDSLEGNISDSTADLVQWGCYDMPAVLEELQRIFPAGPYYLIGHSAGGQLIGLMHNHEALRAVATVAASSGSLRNIGGMFGVKARFFMSIFIPLMNATIGYTPSQWVGMGQPLPKGVARQWAQWCNGSHYVRMAFGAEIQQHWFDHFDKKMLWCVATDDTIAVRRNVEEMVSVFSAAESQVLEIVPANYGLQEIGHMKFFSRSSKRLWPIVLDFFHADLSLR